jgi:hypothetical protein
MAIRTVVTRGYGNGTFNGTIALVVTRGYAIGAAVEVIMSLANLAGVNFKEYLAGVDFKEYLAGVLHKDKISGA